MNVCVCSKHKCWDSGYCKHRCKGIKPQSCDDMTQGERAEWNYESAYQDVIRKWSDSLWDNPYFKFY